MQGCIYTMNHYSEQDIERFVVNVGTTASHRIEFESHIRQCASCKELYDEITQFYQQLNNEQKLLSTDEQESSLLPTPVFHRNNRLVSIDKPALAVRTWRFIRRKPLASGISFFGLMVLALFSFQNIMLRFDDNPLYYRFNEANDRLEIFNAQDKLLWDVPVSSAKSFNDVEGRHGTKNIAIEDLNNDGRNEIITTISFGNHLEKLPSLQILDGNKNILITIDSLHPPNIRFRGVEYQRSFYATGFKVISIEGKKNIFVLSNNGRSPQILSRFDNTGNLIGTYWHFGQIGMIESMDIDADGSDEIILIGMNDTSFPDITHTVTFALEPSKIIGDKESSTSRGFGFDVADYEKMYFRYPRNDIELALKLQNVPYQIRKDKNSLQVYIRTNLPDGKGPDLEYVFSNTLEPIAIKGNDPGARFYDQLKSEGKVFGTYGNEYFEALRKQIEYWNGNSWIEQKYFLNSEHSNPYTYLINRAKESVEIFNLKGKMLWSFSTTTDIQRFVNNTDEYNNNYVVIKDIDQDGRTEVITTLSTLNSKSVSVKVFNADGLLQFEKPLGSKTRFRVEDFPNIFSARGLVVEDFDKNGKSEIYAGAYHRNSPFVLTKFDHLGAEVGQYWTFGHAFGVSSLSLEKEKYLSLTGINDVEQERFALLIILDAKTLNGITSGTLFQEYNLPLSTSEHAIVQFPKTEVENTFVAVKPRATKILHQDEAGFSVNITSPIPDGELGMDYYFSRNLLVSDIKPTDSFKQHKEELRQKGMLSNDVSLITLRSKMKYWDGSRWKSEPQRRTKEIAIP